MVVGREEDLLAGRVEERGPVGPRQVRHAARVRAVGVGDVEVERAGLDDVLGEESPVRLERGTLGTARAPDDRAAVG